MLKLEDFNWLFDGASIPEDKKAYVDTYTRYVNCILKRLGDYKVTYNETEKVFEVYGDEYGLLASIFLNKVPGESYVEIRSDDDDFAIRTFEEWRAISRVVDMTDTITHEIKG